MKTIGLFDAFALLHEAPVVFRLDEDGGRPVVSVAAADWYDGPVPRAVYDPEAGEVAVSVSPPGRVTPTPRFWSWAPIQSGL